MLCCWLKNVPVSLLQFFSPSIVYAPTLKLETQWPKRETLVPYLTACTNINISCSSFFCSSKPNFWQNNTHNYHMNISYRAKHWCYKLKNTTLKIRLYMFGLMRPCYILKCIKLSRNRFLFLLFTKRCNMFYDLFFPPKK